MGGVQARVQNQMQSATEKAAQNYAQEQVEKVYRWPFCQHVDKISSVVGGITAVVVWFAAFSSLGVTTIGLAIYLFIIAVPLTFLELNWLINKCPFCKGEGFCCTLWKYTQLLDTWKRAIAYAIAAIPCFIIPIVSFMGVICGLLLFFLAIVYAVKRFQFSGTRQAGFQDIGATQSAPGNLGGGGGMQDPAFVNQSQYTNYP